MRASLHITLGSLPRHPPPLRACSHAGATLLHRPFSTTRLHASAPETTAEEAAKQLLEKFGNKTFRQKQILDGNQLQKLCITLNRDSQPPPYPSNSTEIVSSRAPANGTPIPQGYHLIYFTPCILEEHLGPDGSDATFNPSPPFSRRMWAGGSMKWYNDKPLKVGDEVEEVTRIASAVAKKSKSRNSANGGGDDMVLVDVEKSLFDSDRNLCLVDRRSWIFRKPLATLSQPSPDYSTSRNSSPPESYKTEIRDDPDKGIRHFRFSPVSLFRFSALTFNAHMIHYNEAWTRQREGHPNVVVHGPLNLINVVDFWRDSFSSHKKVGTEHKAMMEQLSQHEVTVTYRALAPIYAGERFTMEMSTPPRVGKEEGHDNDGRNVIAVKKKKKTVGEDRVGEVEEEVVCMTAEIAWVLPGPAPGIND